MTSGTMTKLVLPGMSIPTGVIHEFDIDVYRNSSSSNYGEGIRVYASTNGEIEGATELAFISRSYTTVYAVNNDTIDFCRINIIKISDVVILTQNRNIII